MKLTELEYQAATQSLYTIRDYLRYIHKLLQVYQNNNNIYFGHGYDNAWDEAIALLLYFNKLNNYDNNTELLNLLLDAKFTELEKQELYKLLDLRLNQRVPLSYITKSAKFCNLDFYVDNRVLIPRSPIAELILSNFENILDLDYFIENNNKLDILEIGTGSGCIAIAMYYYLSDLINNDKLNITATDISDRALEVAKFNINNFGFDNNVNLIKSDLYKNLDQNKKYDLIISNPPYVDKSDMDNIPKEYLHEPRGALESGLDGLDLVRDIINKSVNYLKNNNSILIVEVGNSKPALEQAYPNLDFIWLDFEHGGDGVFLLTKQQITNIIK